MKRPNVLFLFFFTLLLPFKAALALPDDRDKPIHIQADSAELDDKKGVALYSGSVIITQGSIKITGQRATIKRAANGSVSIFTATGKPATFSQQPEADKEIVDAYGLTIQYSVQKDQVLLIDQAKVVQGGNTFEGEKIVYDTVRQIVNAGRASGQSITTPRPRIDMLIQPKNSSEETKKNSNEETKKNNSTEKGEEP